jgi:hypothetical protein
MNTSENIQEDNTYYFSHKNISKIRHNTGKLLMKNRPYWKII